MTWLIPLVLAWSAVAFAQDSANLADPSARRAYRALLDGPSISIAQYERAREALRAAPAQARVELALPAEPGETLIVTGTVRDAVGRPVAGALLHLYQTDAQGHYTRERVMDEPHARIFDFIRTGADGRFEFSTIRPGGYPGRPDRQGEEWRIPSHIHFEIDAAGLSHRGFQMVMDDDPRMTPRWHQWAKDGHHPVVHVVRGQDGVSRAVCDVVLERRQP